MNGPFLQLTVADREATPHGAFIPVARWSAASVADGRCILAHIEASIAPGAEIELRDAPFAFILDLFDTPSDHLGECRKPFGLQLATSLARDEVMAWLSERPSEDEAVDRVGAYCGPFPENIIGAAA